MLKRTLSALVLLPLLIFLLIYGGLPIKIAVGIVSLMGMREFYMAFSAKPRPEHIIGYIFAIIYMFFTNQIIFGSNIFNIFSAAFILCMLIYLVIFHNKTNIEEIFITLFGFFYVCFLLSHVYLTRDFVNGKFFVWLIFLCAYGCDTGAYLVGMTMGKHKLIPSLSPKKTIEGAVGGVVIATALCMIFGVIVESKFTVEYINTPLFCALTGLIGSILSQFGDLAASAMKRYTGIKDFGNLIPGHGGILDRFDSVLFTAPAVYYLMIFLSEIQL